MTMLSLVLSPSRPSRCTGDTQDIIQGEPDMGDRGLGSLTLFPALGCFRISPCMFLMRWPMPLVHDRPGEGPVEPQAPLLGLAKGRHDPLSYHSLKAGCHLCCPLKRGTRGSRLHNYLPCRPQSLRWQRKGEFHALLRAQECGHDLRSSASTSLSAYADLLGHHLRSTLHLIATPTCILLS